MKAKFKSIQNKDIENIIWWAQAATSYKECQMELSILAMADEKASKYLDAIDHNKWALYTQIGKMRLYGWQTTNFVESENNAAVGKRSLYLYHFFSDVMTTFMKNSFE